MNCADPFFHLLWVCRGDRAAFILTKCHLCCSCLHSTVSCPSLAHCGRITMSVVPEAFGTQLCGRQILLPTLLSDWKRLGIFYFQNLSTEQISALHFNVQITVQFFSFCRLPNRPIINTPVVSTAIHSDGELPPNLVEKPIIVEYAMLETEERTKPVCVFWNHSITYVSCLL